MSSLILRPALLPQSSSASASPSPSASSSSSSLILLSWRSNKYKLCSSFRLSRKSRRLSFKTQSFDSSKNGNDADSKKNPNGGDSMPPNGTLRKSRREILLEYVQNVQPEIMELFLKRAPQQVVEAMRHTVTNMIGTLPPQFFAVTVTTVAENLAQLMYSVMMTGYMFRNAQHRLELQQSLEQVALPEAQERKDKPDFAPGTQKKVTGEVIRWNNVSGPEKIDAVKYIELLETEIEELNRQIDRKSANEQNELLEYLKSLEPQNLKDLTSSAGEDVVVAINTFIKRLLAISDPSQMKVPISVLELLTFFLHPTKIAKLHLRFLSLATSVTETSATELAKLLYWLMVVGYSIRNIEVRFDMERVLGAPPKLPELPPGENL